MLVTIAAVPPKLIRLIFFIVITGILVAGGELKEMVSLGAEALNRIFKEVGRGAAA